MPRVTVLVAVYNAAEYLQKCLDSLAAQTLTDVQVVCIDDASTDDSLTMLRRQAALDSRFHVIALANNRGQAFARNRGLEQAEGRYVCFLDSDDWLSADALEQAVAQFELHDEADCVLFEVENVYDDHSERYVMPAFESLSGEQAFRLSLDWQIHGVYMVRTELHRRFPYDDTCRAYSDDNTTRLHFLEARSIRRCQGIYYYLQRPGSVTHAVDGRRFDFLRANESMKCQLVQLHADTDVMQQWEAMRMLVLVDVYMFYHQHGRELPVEVASYGLSELRRVWTSIDRSLLLDARVHKFGYRPMPWWWLFRVQEWLYFTLRRWWGKNR